MRKVVLLFSALPVFVTGCTTLITLSEAETKNKIYSGTIRQADLKCGHGTCFDFPFSLIADTALLPVTIPWTVFNLASGDATSNSEDAKMITTPPSQK
ncbi:YceK/YidQ family lipoprotein [Zoogloea sp. LCSB751]|uniref:YceK/YidQ family lipoprotein n=1 Tax=Zoogloea sp. LCSB751 TaxID=1965277 RepID=UPI001116C3B6|nr:YceK/YidQ family lipoprotein [Zoogloea sp. LCSB751]